MFSFHVAIYGAIKLVAPEILCAKGSRDNNLHVLLSTKVFKLSAYGLCKSIFILKLAYLPAKRNKYVGPEESKPKRVCLREIGTALKGKGP